MQVIRYKRADGRTGKKKKMTNIEIYHEITRITSEIYELNHIIAIKLKCKRICDLCNRGTANERLGEDTIKSGDVHK